MSTETESSHARTQKLEGLGTRRKRGEDVRFTLTAHGPTVATFEGRWK